MGLMGYMGLMGLGISGRGSLTLQGTNEDSDSTEFAEMHAICCLDLIYSPQIWIADRLHLISRMHAFPDGQNNSDVETDS
jgi:hypothetical protein